MPLLYYYPTQINFLICLIFIHFLPTNAFRRETPLQQLEAEENNMNVHGLGDVDDRVPNSDRRLHHRGIGRPQNHNNHPREEDNGMPWGDMDFATTPAHLRFSQENRVLMISGSKQLKNPRDEHYWDMLMLTFCPSWEWISLTMLLILAITGMFIGQCIYGINTNENADLLEIQRVTLVKFGANLGTLVHDGQVYRLLSAIFVHLDFIHYIGNTFATFILVSRVEYTFGVVRTLIMFILSGIGGNIFSLAVDVSGFATIVKGGASTSLYGMIGVILGYIIINWAGLKLVGQALRCTLLCFFMFLLLFVLLFTPGTSSTVDEIDNWGHLGGFLTGIWVSAIGTPLVSSTRQTVIRTVFVVLLVGQFLGTFLGFYLSH